jgi:hypothetical protein
MTDPRYKSGPLESALQGAGIGAALALLLLGVGLVRIAFHSFAGETFDAFTQDDIRLAVFYISAFMVAGAFIGGLRAVTRSRIAKVVSFMIGGAIAMNVIAIGDLGIGGVDIGTAVIMSGAGAFLALAVLVGWSAVGR